MRYSLVMPVSKKILSLIRRPTDSITHYLQQKFSTTDFPSSPTHTKKFGCLIINLGSPTKPEPREIKTFLRKFLSDQRVVTWPRPIWLPILHSVVLRNRPHKIAPIYQHIWLPEGSPITVYTQRQASLLAKQLPNVVVRHAFTYSHPTVAQALKEILQAGVTDLTIIPLYPQYAPSTVGTTVDQVTDFFRSSPQLPQLKIVSSWHINPTYIQWYSQKLATYLQQNSYDCVVMSYHSLPAAKIHGAKQYKQQCTQTTAAIVHQLQKLPVQIPKILQTYQSKFGVGRWVGPATIDTLAKIPAKGMRKVIIATPGFISDCIETVDEIAVLNRDVFLDNGGQLFTVINPPNDDPAIALMLQEIYEEFN